MKFRFRRLSDKEEVTVTLPKKMHDALRERFSVAGAKEDKTCPLCVDALRKRDNLWTDRCSRCWLGKELPSPTPHSPRCVYEVPGLAGAQHATAEIGAGVDWPGDAQMLRNFRRFMARAAKAGARK